MYCGFLLTFLIIKLTSSTRLDDIDRDRFYNELKNNKILFEKNQTQCRMFSKYCWFKIYVENSIDLVNITIFSENTQYFEYLSIQTCDNSTNSKYCLNETDGKLTIGLVYIEPVLVGVGSLVFQFNSTTIAVHTVTITEPDRWIDRFFKYNLIALQLFTGLMISFLLDIKMVLNFAKKPWPVLIGIVCQCGGLPLISLVSIKLFRVSSVEALALFIYGCCPGGTMSNSWTVLFNGDLELSAIMTFVSTIGSLAFMPLWLYTFGTQFLVETKIKLPLLTLIGNLFFIVGPCLSGLILAKYFPKLKTATLKVAKPIIIFILVTILILTFIVKYYVFLLSNWKQWIAGPFIPWCGFLLGAICSFIFRQPWNRIATICIEVGIQNVSIAFLIVVNNFPSPQLDYALIPLFILTIMTTIPLYIAYLIQVIIEKYKKSVDEKDAEKCYNKSNEPNEQTGFIEQVVVYRI